MLTTISEASNVSLVSRGTQLVEWSMSWIVTAGEAFTLETLRETLLDPETRYKKLLDQKSKQSNCNLLFDAVIVGYEQYMSASIMKAQRLQGAPVSN